ncbi:MAG: O-antigen ligase family protein [Acidobacteriota bacterium]|nr:O-antigen ligase family protein [Acidobacteriota bacterium]
MVTHLKKALREPVWLVGILWPVVLVVPYLPGPPRPSVGGLSWRQEIVLALLLSMTTGLLLKRWRTGQVNLDLSINPSSGTLMVAAGLFILWIIISLSWSANPYSAAHFAFQWGAYVLFFVLIRLVAARPRVLRASIYALGSVVWLLSISCLIETIAGAALTDHSLRLTAKPLLRGFSGFSETMAVAIPIFVGLAFDVRKARRAALCGATALFAWLATIQALERAPILGATAGLVLLIVGILAVHSCRPRSLHRVGLLASAFVVVTVLQFAPFTVSNTDSPQQLTSLHRFQSTSVADPSTSARLLFWAAGWEMFRAHPVRGVGANNYEVAFPWARAQFAATHRNSPLTKMNEQLLTQYAHNEYVQILAELGGIGLFLFLAFCSALILTFWRALRRARRPLLALGSGAGLLVFAVSSGASAFSFRWLGSGLVFFFAAGLVSHFASHSKQTARKTTVDQRPTNVSFRAPTFAYPGLVGALVFSVLMLLWASIQATNSVTHALAQTNHGSHARAEHLYLIALRCNPFEAATHYDYGSLLYEENRVGEGVSHLRYAVDHGINTSIGYANLAAAEEGSHDLPAAERTLAYAVKVYPRSVFLLVRHAAALSRLGRTKESEVELSEAVLIDSRAARGWYHLINFDIDAAMVAAKRDTTIATPGELVPESAVFVVLKENERRLNISPTSGWRGRVRTIDN